MILYTFLINAALAAMASLLISPIYLAKFSNGEHRASPPSSRPSSAASTRCAARIAGGLVVGIVDNLAAAYVSTSYRQAVPLALLVADHPVPAARPARPQRGARGMTRPALRACCCSSLAGAALVLAPVDLTGFGIP